MDELRKRHTACTSGDTSPDNAACTSGDTTPDNAACTSGDTTSPDNGRLSRLESTSTKTLSEPQEHSPQDDELSSKAAGDLTANPEKHNIEPANRAATNVVLGKAASSNVVSEKAAPSNIVPGKAATSNVVSGKAASSNVVSGKAASSRIATPDNEKLRHIQLIMIKAQQLKMQDSELHNLFKYSKFYFSILRRLPWFGLNLRQKHLVFDSVVTPFNDRLSASVDSLKESRVFTSKGFWASIVLLLMIASSVYLVYNAGLFNSGEQCLENNERLGVGLKELYRQPMDCNVCRHLTSVPEVNNITREEFRDKFAYSGVPVILRGTGSSFFTKNVTFDHFKTEFTKYPKTLDEIDKECSFFPYHTEFKYLSEVFKMPDKRVQMMEGQRPWYVGWNSCTEKSKALSNSMYKIPEFLPPMETEKHSDWIFMGGAGNGAPLHLDDVQSPSWQAQLSGRKTWRLLPSYECESVCQHLEVTLNTGDIFVVDTNIWFHSTYIHPGAPSITIGYEFF